MSTSNPNDPRLLLPEWLRDDDVPQSGKGAVEIPQPPRDAVAVVESVTDTAVAVESASAVPSIPYSERLSLDTQLDPQRLLSIEDLPAWLGGVERQILPGDIEPPLEPEPTRQTDAILEEPEPYLGADAPQDGVAEVTVNNWMIVLGAIGLIVLVAAAFRLYVS
ncbi:MAG: hypothetical protein KC438_13700 [Thermomicrobiales bacterium]|nr:hypothetical protein [Thermomicrobiales bacterium]